MGRLNIFFALNILVALGVSACGGGGNNFPESPPSNAPSTSSQTTTSASTPASTSTPPSSATTPPPANTTTAPAPTTPAPSSGGNSNGHGHPHDDDEDRAVVRSLAVSTAPTSIPAAAITAETIQGNAIAVWRAFDGVRNNLWANERVAGIWQKSRLLETQDGDVGAVVLATDVSGNAFAVWEQRVGNEQLLWAARYTAQYAWEAPVVISLRAALNQTPGVVATNPQVSFDASGVAVVTWQQTDSTLYPRTWQNTYIPNVGWQGAHAITP